MLGPCDRGAKMLGTVDRQGSLLGVDSLLSRLFEGDDDSFYARMAAHGHDIIGDADFAQCYSPTIGRPSIPPSLMMRAVLCQIRDDVSDREAARRAAKDLDWKRALGIEADTIPFHHTSFSVFRSRLLVNDADGVVLARSIERAVAAGLFAKKVLAIADSTGVMGAAAVADTYELIRAAIAKLVAAAGGPKALPARLRREARAAVRGKAAVDWADAAARRGELGRLVALDRVVSVVDPEMRHGRKSTSKRVDGYKAHLLTDHDSELILGVAVTPANDPDGPEAAPLVASARDAGVPVAEMLGDTAYGDGDPRVAVEAAGATVTAKTQPPSSTCLFFKIDFVVDPGTPSATCPAGQVTTHHGWSTDGKGRRVMVLRFPAATCAACPLRDRCTTNADGRSITLNFHEARLQAARFEQARPSTRNKLRRRALVERKLAEIKRHGAGKARYRGARKVLLQQRLTAAVVNLKRLFTIHPEFGAADA